MRCSAPVSDKQTALGPAVACVFPHAQHGLCQVHYFKNVAEPVADADEALKKTLRQAVRSDLKAVLRPPSPEHTGVLTVTGLLPSLGEALEIAAPTPDKTARPPGQRFDRDRRRAGQHCPRCRATGALPSDPERPPTFSPGRHRNV